MELTSNQISEWEAYDRLDPIGTFRADYRMASLSATVTNLVLSLYGKKGVKHTSANEFLPKWDEMINEDEVELKTNKQSANEMRDILMSIASNHNRSMNKKGKR